MGTAIITDNNLERRIELGFNLPPVLTDNWDGDGWEEDRDYYIFLKMTRKGFIYATCNLEVFKNEFDFSLRDFLLMSVVHNPAFVQDNLTKYDGENLENLELEQLRDLREKHLSKYGRMQTGEENIMGNEILGAIEDQIISKMKGYKTPREELEIIKHILSGQEKLVFLYDLNCYPSNSMSSNIIKMSDNLSSLFETHPTYCLPQIRTSFVHVQRESDNPQLKGYGQVL